MVPCSQSLRGKTGIECPDVQTMASPTMSIYRSKADSGGCSLLEVYGRLIYRNSHDKFQSSSFEAKITTGTHTACIHAVSTPEVVK